MKITKIQSEVKKIALKKPFTTALRSVADVEFVRIHIFANNEIVGIGEAPATKAITGEDLEDIQNAFKKMHDSLMHKSVSDALAIVQNAKIGTSAKAALNIALVNLQARSMQIPLYKYFNAKMPCNITTDITISLSNADEMLRDAQQAYQDGFEILKVKLGADIYHAIEVTKSIAAVLPDVALLIDANQAWSESSALEYIDGIAGVDVALIEQPVVADNLVGLKNITNYSTIPILADESVFSYEDAKKIIENKYADMINVKLMKCGGLLEAAKIFEYAREKKVKCMLGSMLEGPYSINATLHLAMAYHDVIDYFDLDSPLLYEALPNEIDFGIKNATYLLKEGR